MWNLTEFAEKEKKEKDMDFRALTDGKALRAKTVFLCEMGSPISFSLVEW